MTYTIQIFDGNHKNVGELMTASLTDIMALLNKGMIVVNKETGQEFTQSDVCSMIGVSESVTTV